MLPIVVSREKAVEVFLSFRFWVFSCSIIVTLSALSTIMRSGADCPEIYVVG